MKPEEVAGKLQPHRDELRATSVRTLALFGSVVRGEGRPDSDVDLLVEFDEVPGFIGVVRLQRRLEADPARLGGGALREAQMVARYSQAR